MAYKQERRQRILQVVQSLTPEWVSFKEAEWQKELDRRWQAYSTDSQELTRQLGDLFMYRLLWRYKLALLTMPKSELSKQPDKVQEMMTKAPKGLSAKLDGGLLFDDCWSSRLSGRASVVPFLDDLTFEDIFDGSYIILHDRDQRESWNEATQTKVMELKPEHFHFLFKFKSPSLTIFEAAHACGVESQYVEKAKTGRFAWSNALSYLIHAKDSHKYQYSPSDVHTLCGESYESIFGLNKEAWENGRAKKNAKRYAEDAESLYQKLLTGQLTKQQMLLSDELYLIYGTDTVRFDRAIKAYTERRFAKADEAVSSGDYNVKVLYICGPSGSGKTKYAEALINKYIAMRAEAGERVEVCKTGHRDPLGYYGGEEILLMDDVRPGSLGAADWLKLLDPIQSTPISSRYRNKVVSSRLIVMTSVYELDDFFLKLIDSHVSYASEPLDQFLRRIWQVVEFVKVGSDLSVVLHNVVRLDKPRKYEVRDWTGSWRTVFKETHYGLSEVGRASVGDEYLQIDSPIGSMLADAVISDIPDGFETRVLGE